MSASGTVYAGVTRWRGAETVEDALSGVFRLRAGDGATDWEHLTRGLPEGCHVPCVAVHPTDPTVVYAGTDSGPYRSTDGGARWARMPFPREDRQVWSFAFHPADLWTRMSRSSSSCCASPTTPRTRGRSTRRSR